MSVDVILYRTDYFDAEAGRIVDELASASGSEVAILIDERHRPAGPLPRTKINPDAAELARLGLHVPEDFAWRCGDYGFYLARRHWPTAERFWMIEHDVRITDGRQFFALMREHANVDLVAAYLRPAETDWWWYRTAMSRNAAPQRCLFPVVRLSRRAIDVLLAKRIEHASKPWRRLLWPNDEAFVATTVAAAGLLSADLNALGHTLYNEESFSFRTILDGRTLPPAPSGPLLYHPVLTGERLERKRHSLAREGDRKPVSERLVRKYVPHVAALFAW